MVNKTTLAIVKYQFGFFIYFFFFEIPETVNINLLYHITSSGSGSF